MIMGMSYEYLSRESIRRIFHTWLLKPPTQDEQEVVRKICEEHGLFYLP